MQDAMRSASDCLSGVSLVMSTDKYPARSTQWMQHLNPPENQPGVSWAGQRTHHSRTWDNSGRPSPSPEEETEGQGGPLAGPRGTACLWFIWGKTLVGLII